MDFEDKKLQKAQQEAEEAVKKLTDDDLAQVSGGWGDTRCDVCGAKADVNALEKDIDGFEF